MHVAIIGCGVIGLSTGITLLEAGHSVTIYSKDLPPNTTSDVAAAFWFPYKVEYTDRVREWAKTSFEKYSQLAQNPLSGVSFIPLMDCYHEETAVPTWADAFNQVQRLAKEEIPEGYSDGFRLEVPLIDTVSHMPFLVKYFRELGGTIIQNEINNLFHLEEKRIINCSGLGAKYLVNDPDLYPISGQIIRLEKGNSEIHEITLGHENEQTTTYIVPRGSDILLGGTANAHDWDLNVNPETEKEILDRCRIPVPAIASLTKKSSAVGLRPARKNIRLEAEKISETIIIHNYGHGGSGYTLCWGCAAEVKNILQNLPTLNTSH